MCFLSFQSPIARLTTLYCRPSTGSGPVNGVSAPFSVSSSALYLPKMPSCPGTHTVEPSCVSLVHWGIPGIWELRFDSHWFQDLYAAADVHGAMGSNQNSFTLVWRWHQLSCSAARWKACTKVSHYITACPITLLRFALPYVTFCGIHRNIM